MSILETIFGSKQKKSDAQETESAEGKDQSDLEAMNYEQGRESLRPKEEAGETDKATAADEVEDPMSVGLAQVTFDAEGNDDAKSIYFTRKLHWPGTWSGVTIGRGYDMKERSSADIKQDMIDSGIAEATAETFSGGAGLKNADAKAFCTKHKDLIITQAQQKALFTVSYGEKSLYAADRVRAWSGEELGGLSLGMQGIIIDLFYRGDITYKTHWKDIRSVVLADDLKGLLPFLKDQGYWGTGGNLDDNRYQSRIAFVEGVLDGSIKLAGLPIPGGPLPTAKVTAVKTSLRPVPRPANLNTGSSEASEESESSAPATSIRPVRRPS